jgi:ankyrin repeat protein
MVKQKKQKIAAHEKGDAKKEVAGFKPGPDEDKVKPPEPPVEKPRISSYRKEKLNKKLITAAGWGGPVENLLDAGADPDACDYSYGEHHGEGALRIAAKCGNMSAVRTLVKRGAIYGKDLALLYAVKYDSTETARVLIDAGADVNYEEQINFEGLPWRDSRTPLRWAAEKGHDEMVRLLIAKGADMDAYALCWAAEAGHTETVRLLIDEGADVDGRGDYGTTALAYAAWYGHTATVDLLIEKGADVNAKNKGEKTALMVAAGKGHIATVRLLIEKGADVNAIDKDKQSALIRAADNGHTETVELLVEKGADVSFVGIARVKEHGYYDWNGRYHANALDLAVKNNDAKMVKILIEKEADLKDTSVKRAMQWAIYEGHHDIIRFLAEKGVGLNVKMKLNQWITIYEPTRTMASVLAKGDAETAKVLIENGFDVNVKDSAGFTVMMRILDDEGYTRRFTKKDMIRFLLENGADVNARTNYGWTVLMEAARVGDYEGMTEVAEFLIENGADVNARDDDGRTALMIADKHYHDAMVRVLKEHGAEE